MEFHDTDRYGVVREPDGTFTVIDKQRDNKCVLNTLSRRKAHNEADRLSQLSLQKEKAI